MISYCFIFRPLVVEYVFGQFLSSCIEFNRADFAKRAFQAVQEVFPIASGRLRAKYFFLMYFSKNYGEIIETFHKNTIGSSDQEDQFYLASLIRVGTPEAYRLINEDTEMNKRLYETSTLIYILFAIEQNDFDEALNILNRTSNYRYAYEVTIKSFKEILQKRFLTASYAQRS